MSRCLFLFAALAFAGCGGGLAPPLPSETEGRQALQTMLDTWKDGKPASTLSQGTPPIEGVDFEWIAGKKLASYTIGAESQGEGTKTFAVSLTLVGETAKDVQYMLLGKSPIHIYRDEDFTRMLNMDNNPVPPKAK